MQKRGSKASLGVVLACCIFIFAFLTANVFAVESGGIGGRPANPRIDNPRSQSIFVYELEAGKTITDQIQVVNNSSGSKNIAIYPVDSQISSGGAFACAQKADKPHEVGTWIKLEKDAVRLDSTKDEKVNFTVSVPKDTPAGEYNGCIVIQDTGARPVSQGNGITLSFRSAIRVAITVPGDIKKGLFFKGVDVAKEGKKLKLSAYLRNNGNVSLDSDINVNVKTIIGTIDKKAGGTFPILRSQESRFNFEADKPFWGGIYVIQGDAKYNSDPSKSIGEEGKQDTVHSAKKYIWVNPDPLALVIELLALAAIGRWLYRRHKLRQLHAKSTAYRVKKGDTLHSIAKQNGVKWKDIAKINKLKPPYHLDPEQILKLPPTGAQKTKQPKKKPKTPQKGR